jgi:hypothetical protein
LIGIEVPPISQVQQELLAELARAMRLRTNFGFRMRAGYPVSVVKKEEESKAGAEQDEQATGTDAEDVDDAGVFDLGMENVNTQDQPLEEHFQHT